MTDSPHIIIKSTSPGRASVEGVCDCDDAILFCRVACDIMASPMAYEMRQKFLSEMMVSVLRATCGHKEGLEALDKARELLIANEKVSAACG